MLIVTPSEMLQRGLLLAHHSAERQARVNENERLARFKAEFGKTPVVLVNLWNDLQQTKIEDAKIVDATDQDLVKFLWTFAWLKSYETESKLVGRTGWCDCTVRKHTKEMVKKIHALMPSKIFWPEEWNNPSKDTPIFLMSVDGTHCPINEPTKGHPFSKNPKYYSHKFNRSGLSYEVGFSIFTSQVVWINGPFPAGKGDDDIFAEGLKHQIPVGKKVIADGAYKRKDLPMISVKNNADKAHVALFKRRVLSRHESFFAKMKVFDILTTEFRHGEALHKVVFEAVAVICQYEIEVVPLFDA